MPKQKALRNQRIMYTPREKKSKLLEVKELIKLGSTAVQACKKAKLPHTLFYRWRKEFKPDPLALPAFQKTKLKRKNKDEDMTAAQRQARLACIVGTPKEISVVLRGLK